MSLLELRLVGVVAIVLALLGGVAAWDKHERDLGRDAAQSAQREADARQTAVNQAQRAATIATQQEAADEGAKFDTQRAADARGLDDFMQRLHDRAAAAQRAAAAAAASTPGRSAAASVPDPNVVCTGLCLRAADAAAQLAKTVDCLRGASTQCARDYDALTPEKP